MATATKKRKTAQAKQKTTTTAKKPVKSAGAMRVQKHREMMRAMGYKPVTRWVKDKKDPAYLERCRLAVENVSKNPGEKELLEYIDHLWDSGALAL